MERIIKFQAIDGKEFTSKNECLKYESLIERVDSIMKLLPPTPDDERLLFENGTAFLQHKKQNLINARIRLLELCKEYIDHHWIQLSIDDITTCPSFVHRILGEYNIRPLSHAWYRFYCIDKQHREWGQPYYAMEANKQNVTYNDKRRSNY